MGALPSTDLEGYELLKDRVQGSLDLLQEGRALDFKRATAWDELKQGIPKDILAMSNLRDGGIIIIGVEESDNKWNRTGITNEQLNTYNPDEMIDHVNKYASPSMTFDVVTHIDNEGLKYLVIRAHEFEEKPFVCKRNCANEIRQGAFYIRPLGKSESREVQSADEMQDVLDLAVDKSVRKFLQRCERIGMLVRVPKEEFEGTKEDNNKFDAELEGL